MLLDEAHTLEIDVGRALLNASQQVRAVAPFLLVLAGTPGLPERLRQMDASFWSRLGEGLLGVGRLDDAAARKALSEPLAGREVAINECALKAVVEHSQRYGYFIQLWGDALWRRHEATGATPLAMPAVDAARPDVAGRIADYYQERYEELRDDGLLAAAVLSPRSFRPAWTPRRPSKHWTPRWPTPASRKKTCASATFAASPALATSGTRPGKFRRSRGVPASVADDFRSRI